MTDIKKLSDAATQGELSSDGGFVNCDNAEDGYHEVGAMADVHNGLGCENAEFIAALVNAYRNGTLVPVSEAGAAVRAEREACAEIARSHIIDHIDQSAFMMFEDIANAIRARGGEA